MPDHNVAARTYRTLWSHLGKPCDSLRFSQGTPRIGQEKVRDRASEAREIPNKMIFTQRETIYKKDKVKYFLVQMLNSSNERLRKDKCRKI